MFFTWPWLHSNNNLWNWCCSCSSLRIWKIGVESRKK